MSRFNSPEVPPSIYHKWNDGKPTHVVQRIPVGIKPCRFFLMEIMNNDSALQLFYGDSVAPQRRSRKHSHQPRTTEIKVTFPCDVILKEVRLALDGASIEFIGRPVSVLALQDSALVPSEVELVSYYERKVKRKVLNAFYFTDEQPPASIHHALARFDHFYACDTNTWTFLGGERISACVVLHGRIGAITSDHSSASYELAHVKMGENISGNPELSAVRDLVALVQSSQSLMPAKPIGIIIDSELGELKCINARTRPVFDDFYLPMGFEMVHATDASGTTEYFTNLMIRACDSLSTEALCAYQVEHGLIRV